MLPYYPRFLLRSDCLCEWPDGLPLLGRLVDEDYSMVSLDAFFYTGCRLLPYMTPTFIARTTIKSTSCYTSPNLQRFNAMPFFKRACDKGTTTALFNSKSTLEISSIPYPQVDRNSSLI
jgi:hypothetical protein